MHSFTISSLVIIYIEPFRHKESNQPFTHEFFTGSYDWNEFKPRGRRANFSCSAYIFTTRVHAEILEDLTTAEVLEFFLVS